MNPPLGDSGRLGQQAELHVWFSKVWWRPWYLSPNTLLPTSFEARALQPPPPLPTSGKEILGTGAQPQAVQGPG